ncbi:MAG: hypothetical protein GY800_06835 [Planctomycetes bacterium]|nr:hypothetical protein [Planctomycetota bacterium]
MKKCAILGLGLLLVFCFVTSQVVYAQAESGAKGKPCPKRKIHKKFWCETCKEVSEFPDCSNQEYMWNSAEHKAKEANPHANLPETWACATAGYHCVKCGKCYPRPGICFDCDDDTQSIKSFAKIVFKCEKGHEHSEPGTGFKLREGAYEEEIEDAGNCPECGKSLEMICTKSGTCPHTM